MKFGICTAYKNYAAVTQMGYDYIELSGSEITSLSDNEFENLTLIIANGTIPCLGLNDYCKDAPVMVGDLFDEKAIRSYAQKVMLRGSRLGVKTVGIGSPSIRRLPKGYSFEKANAQCKTFLSILLEEAKPYGILVLLESVHQHLCDFATTVAQAHAIVTDIDDASLRLVVDFYHMLVMHEDFSDISNFAPNIAHTHISGCGDNYSRPYLSSKDIPMITDAFQSLQAIGYDKTLSVECNASDFDTEANKTLLLLKSLWKV